MLVRFDGQRWKANLVRQSDCWATSVTERTQDCTNRLVGFAYLPDRGDVPVTCYGGFADSTAKESIAAADDELPLRCRSCCHGGMFVEVAMEFDLACVLDRHLDLGVYKARVDPWRGSGRTVQLHVSVTNNIGHRINTTRQTRHTVSKRTEPTAASRIVLMHQPEHGKARPMHKTASGALTFNGSALLQETETGPLITPCP